MATCSRLLTEPLSCTKNRKIQVRSAKGWHREKPANIAGLGFASICGWPHADQLRQLKSLDSYVTIKKNKDEKLLNGTRQSLGYISR